MDKPYFYNIFETTISYFIINDISKILKLSTNFIKTTKLKKIGCIKNYENIKELDNLLNFKKFKPILDLITPSIYKYINLIFKKQYVKFKYTKVFYHIDKQNDLNTNYNFNDSDFTIYLCLQNFNKKKDSIIFLNPMTEMFKLNIFLNNKINNDFLVTNNLNIKLNVGKVIIFPSYLRHFFHQNKELQDRILLVMNIKMI